MLIPSASAIELIVLAVNMPAARPLAGAGVTLHRQQLLVVDRPDGVGADGLEHVAEVDRLAVVLARQDRAVVDDDAGQVEAGGGHQHRRDRLVAPAEPDEAVEALGEHDRLHRVGDHLAADERGAHPLVSHRDAVGDGDRAELHRKATGVADAPLDVFGQLAQRHVARRDLVPRRRHADLRLLPVVVGHPDGPQHRPRRGLADPVGHLTRARLDVDVGALCCVHSSDSTGSGVGDPGAAGTPRARAAGPGSAIRGPLTNAIAWSAAGGRSLAANRHEGASINDSNLVAAATVNSPLSARRERAAAPSPPPRRPGRVMPSSRLRRGHRGPCPRRHRTSPRRRRSW